MALSDELIRLAELRDRGVLSDEEFAKAKEDALAGSSPTFGQRMGESVNNISSDVTNLTMFMHLGQLFPGPGWLVPLILWLTKKDESPAIDAHGKVILNWILSAMIYGFVGSLLIFVGVGVLILPVLFVMGLVFPIIGAIKAKDGELWPYPLTIEFMK
ncbi:MAG: DUF4870 domain-containing protein [Planctomycetes bacterium]|nr:DUF4870 domain-containing protein [Planctomycetota bacterium]